MGDLAGLANSWRRSMDGSDGRSGFRFTNGVVYKGVMIATQRATVSFNPDLCTPSAIEPGTPCRLAFILL